MRRSSTLVMMAAIACGPTTMPPATATSGGSSAGPSSTSNASNSSSADGTGSTTPATSTGPAGTTSGASTDSTGASPTIELEGLLEYCDDCFNRHTYFYPCDRGGSWCLSGNVHEVWMCTGAYARIRGHVEENPNTFFDAPCGEELFHVDEVVEARLCEASDCGGTTCEAVQCENSCFTNEQCPSGFKCTPWSPTGTQYDGTRCVPVDDDPAGVGEPCTRNEGPPGDSCDAESICVGVDPKTSIGECAPLCTTWKEDCPGEEQCVISGSTEVGFCRPPCDPLDPMCGPGQQCLQRGTFVCMHDADAPLWPGVECADGGECSPTEVCATSVSLPACGFETCCTPLCDTTAPACPPGLMCTPLDYGEPAVYDDLGACFQ